MENQPNKRKELLYLPSNRFLASRGKKGPLAALISSHTLSSISLIIFLHSTESIIIQDCMLGQRRFALIHITKHTTNINTWSINIIRTIRNIIIVIFINYLKIRLILRVRVLRVRKFI